MTDICPIWKAIIQNVTYEPHPWDIARDGSLRNVDKAVVVIRAHFAEVTADLLEALDELVEQAKLAMRREGGEGFWAVERAEAAIAKATGAA